MPGYNNDQFYPMASAKRKGAAAFDEHPLDAKRLCVSTSVPEPLPVGYAGYHQPGNSGGLLVASSRAAPPAPVPMDLQEGPPPVAAAAAAASGDSAAADVRCTTAVAELTSQADGSTQLVGLNDSAVRCYCRPSMDVIHGCRYYFSDYY